MSVSTDPRIGSELLGYRIEALLGRGGMSVVYRAEDLRLKRKVALKLLAPELAEDERFRERFLRESELAASLDHPSIVPIYNAGEHEGQLYIAMRYVEGTDLKQLLKNGPLEPKRALALLDQLADALDAAHARGLVHRDVKPSNALLDGAGHVYLADFGLTKSASDRSAITHTGRIMGTVDYAAPEQIEGKPVDGRADVYSLGCLLYECLAGHVPYPRDSELAVLWAHVHEPPPKLPAHPELDPAIAKALAKDPQQRHPSCRELVEAARDALGLRDIVILRDRKPLLLAALGVPLAIAAGLTAFFLSRGDGASSKPTVPISDSTLVRIDPKTNEVAAVVKVGPGVKAVAVGGRTVWVYNVTEGTVSAIDTESNELQRVTRIATVPREALYWNGPLIAADAVGAWVIGTRGRAAVLTRVRLDRTYHLEYPLQTTPGADVVGVTVGDRAVWVLIRYGRLFEGPPGEEVLRINPRTGTVVRKVSFSPGGNTFYGIAAGAGAIWLTAAETGELYRLDLASLAVTGKVDLGATSTPPAVGQGFVWAAGDWGGRRALLRIDPRTLRRTLVRTGSRDFLPVAFDSGAVWSNDLAAGTVYRLDPRTGKVVRTIRLTPSPAKEPLVTSAATPAIGVGSGGVWVTVSP